MKRIQVLFITMLFLAFITPMNAQKETAGSGTKEAPNFYQIRKQTLDHWRGVIPQGGDGYKAFKRWEHYWEARTLPDGSFPDPAYAEKEWAKYQDANPQARSASSSIANWTSLGPVNTVGGYIGIGRINCIAFHPTNANVIWVGTPAGGLWKSTNGGNTWTTNTDNLASVLALGVSSIALDPQNPNTMYMGTGDRGLGAGTGIYPASLGVYKSTNGGNTWALTGQIQASLIHKVLVHPTNGDIVFAATSNGLFRSANGGDSWDNVVADPSCFDIAFKPGSSSIMYASFNDKFFHSTNGGGTWKEAIGSPIPGSGRIQIAVSANNPDFVALVSSRPRLCSQCPNDGRFNAFYTSVNSGGTIKQKYFGPLNLLSNSTDGSGAGGQGNYNLCITASPTNANTIFIGGVNLWKSVDGGSNWSIANYWHGGQGSPAGVPVVHADKHCLAWQNNSTLFQGNDGGINKTTNNGSFWTDLSSTLVISQMYKIGVSKSDNRVLAGLQDNGTKLKGSSGSWSDVIGGDGMECFFHPTNGNIMYGELNNGRLLRSFDGGNNWARIDIPGNQDYLSPGIGEWATPWAMDPNISTTLYAGYMDVWKSTDQGNSWMAISNNLSNSGLTSLAIAPSNSNIIYASERTQIWKTTNGGGSWVNISSGIPTASAFISYIAIDPVDPNKVYITLNRFSDGNKVFRSTNGGASWTNISGTLRNVPANCITIQPGGNNALYVGTDIGVFYRDGTMSDWIAFDAGLPTVIVTELECKATTGKITAATYGRGVWESDFQSGPANNNLSIAPATQTATSNAGTATYTITSTINWTISDNATWLSVSPTSGTGNATINASFSANTSVNPRTATITVTGGGFSPTASLVQSGVNGGGACNTPTGLLTQNINQTSAKFRWSAVSGVVSYALQYRTLPSGTWTNANPAVFSSSYITVGGLVPGTMYEWRVSANCANGLSSNWSNTLGFTTLAAPNCAAPDYLQTDNITQSSVVASWQPVPGAVSYKLQTRISPNGVWVDTNPSTFSATSILISGFFSNSLYEWRVRANCSNGSTSAWADGIPFFTLAPACNAPTNLSTTNITQNTAFFSWSAVAGASSYKIQFYFGSDWHDLDVPPITATNFSMFGLIANGYYEWRVIANCNSGSESAPSSTKGFYTSTAPICTGGDQFPLFDLYPTGSYQLVYNMYGGEYSVVNVEYGTTYAFSFCSANGGYVAFDGQIFLRTNDANQTLIAYNDNGCGLAPKLVWRAGFTGSVQVLLARFSCQYEPTFSTFAYRAGFSLTDDEAEDRFASDTEPVAFVLKPLPVEAQNQAGGSNATPNAMVSMAVYPNPSAGAFNISFEDVEGNVESAQIYIHDHLGRVVWEKKVAVVRGSNALEVQAPDWPTGMYMVRLLTPTGQQCNQKIVVTKK